MAALHRTYPPLESPPHLGPRAAAPHKQRRGKRRGEGRGNSGRGGGRAGHRLGRAGGREERCAKGRRVRPAGMEGHALEGMDGREGRGRRVGWGLCAARGRCEETGEDKYQDWLVCRVL